MKRIGVVILLTAVICSGAFAQSGQSIYVSARGNDNNPGTEEQPCLTISHALTMLIIANTSELNTITVIGTLNARNSDADGNRFQLFSIDEERDIIITGKPGATGADRAVLSIRGTDAVVAVIRGRIRFEHIEISGGNIGIGIGSSRVTLGHGAVVRGNSGNGVTIMTDGTLVIDGGEVRDNAASGVNVGRGGILIMRNGVISDNRSSNDAGGVRVYPNGTFTMTGGSITGNRATGSGGGVYVRSGGTFNQTGGTISGNTAPQGPDVFRESGSLGSNLPPGTSSSPPAATPAPTTAQPAPVTPAAVPERPVVPEMVRISGGTFTIWAVLPASRGVIMTKALSGR